MKVFMKLFYVKFDTIKKQGPTNVFAIVARDEVHLGEIAERIGSNWTIAQTPTQLNKDW